MSRRVLLAIVTGALTLSALIGAGNAHADTCAIGAVAGAPYYNAMVGGAARLTPTELVYHASNRLGAGHSALGPESPALASDCSRVVLAERIASQIAALGATTDSVQISEIRSRLMPLSKFTRLQITTAMNRFTAAGASDAFGLLQWRAWQHQALLTTLREMTGSQSVSSDGVVSDAQVNLDAVLSEFWFNHFNVSASKATQYVFGSDGYHPTIRANLGGTFYSLLLAVMRHPAMLVYLDNAANRYDSGTGAASNQNLARELLELHTLGQRPKQTPSDPASIYAQSDVVELAKILAGWNAYPYTAAPSNDGFVFNSALAANITVRFLGVDYPNNGAARVEAVLRWLANHPQTKSYICSKLAARFYTPALAVGGRDACIGAWGSDGDLKRMYSALLARPEQWDRANYRMLYRTPVELVVSAMRQLGITASALHSSTISDGRTGNEFAIATMSPQAFLAALDTMHGTRTWQPLWATMLRIEALLGTFRMNVAPPTGYAMEGAAYLSTGYLDRLSRVPLELSGFFDYLHDNARLDQTSPFVRYVLQVGMNNGDPNVFENYVARSLNLGGILTPDAASRTPASYIVPIEHAYTLLVAAGDRSYWAYPPSDPADKHLEKTWPAMAISNASELKK